MTANPLGLPGEPAAKPPRKKRPNPQNAPTNPKVMDRLERDLECVALRRANLEWDVIAKRLGYSNPSHAYQRFMLVMKSYPVEQVDDAREVELQRYNELLAAVWPQCLDTESKNQHWAIDRAAKLMDQRARLMGWNRPVRQEIAVLTESTVDSAIRDLQAQMESQIAQAKAAGIELPVTV